jgi:hypothetical protein
MFDERQLNRCIDCDIIQPQTETNYTLISSRHGWRLTRSFDAEGKKVLEWRCPSCWAAFRDRRKEEVSLGLRSQREQRLRNASAAAESSEPVSRVISKSVPPGGESGASGPRKNTAATRR